MHDLSENQFGVEKRQQPGESPFAVERRRHKRYTVEGEAEVIIYGLQLFRGRVIDLSKAAAADIGMVSTGTAQVCYEVIG